MHHDSTGCCSLPYGTCCSLVKATFCLSGSLCVCVCVCVCVFPHLDHLHDGYPLDHARRTGRGRPPRSLTPMQ